jgi:16S rRNA (cytosine1402-N4)-methyltransferase
MLKNSVDALEVKAGGVYVDATYGGGGHSREILSRLGDGTLVAFDGDADAERNLPDDRRIIFVRNNFRFMRNFLRYHGICAADGIIADLGVSSHHFDDSARGFSFRFPDAPIDMRMNRSAELTAAGALNRYSPERLSAIFAEYGELQRSGRIAAAIVEARLTKPFELVADLLEAVAAFVPKSDGNRFLARLFQALRMEVNGEMAALKHFLGQTVETLTPGGRLAVISYHSLEDRAVKLFMRNGNTEGRTDKDFYGNEITPFLRPAGKAIAPDDDEIENNPRSRSARLRVAQKK